MLDINSCVVARLKKINYGKKHNFFCSNTLFKSNMTNIMDNFVFYMQNILGNDDFVFVINVFFHENDVVWAV